MPSQPLRLTFPLRRCVCARLDALFFCAFPPSVVYVTIADAAPAALAPAPAAACIASSSMMRRRQTPHCSVAAMQTLKKPPMPTTLSHMNDSLLSID
jgi:hypothetical protein